MNKPRISVKNKVEKDFPEFAGEVAGLSIEELNARITHCAKASEAVQGAKEADEELENTKELVKQLLAPYREALAANRLKTRYLIALIKEKGGE